MYQVSIFNNGVETVIHYPAADKRSPRLFGSLSYKGKLSQAEGLSFTIPIGNPGFNLIMELTSKVSVVDIRDNSVKFSGRVLIVKPSMDSDGKFLKTCTCEGSMAYLNDTFTRRWSFEQYTPEQVIRALLNEHNAKVDIARQINVGAIEITQIVTVSTNYESTLNAVIKLRNLIGGDLVVRDTYGTLYLDLLVSKGSDNGVRIDMGYNMRELMVEYDPTDLATRIIPLGYGEGINQLTVKNINGGLDYVEDTDAIATYGLIEAVATNSELQSADTLLVYARNILASNKQPRLTLEVDMLDLSFLAGHELEGFDLGDVLHVNNEIMGINDLSLKVIEIAVDLMQPWNPKLTISTKAMRISDQIVDIKQKTLTLENAPQGSTYMDTYGYSDNVDATHNFMMPVLTSADVVGINRVRLYVEPQKYKANSLSADLGGNGTLTTTSVVGATAHTHDVVVPNHVHTLIHGIVEETYPAGGQILINGTAIPGISVDSSVIDIDITDYISQPGEAYKLEITSTQKGRVSVWVSIQAFIQAK